VVSFRHKLVLHVVYRNSGFSLSLQKPERLAMQRIDIHFDPRSKRNLRQVQKLLVLQLLAMMSAWVGFYTSKQRHFSSIKNTYLICMMRGYGKLLLVLAHAVKVDARQIDQAETIADDDCDFG